MNKIKLIIFFSSVFSLFGCATKGVKNNEGQPTPIFLQEVEDPPFIYEIWQRPDGSKFIVDPKTGKTMEILSHKIIIGTV
jgi:hypothetical protein